MQIETEKTWPISTHETNASALMGIPQRLGDGQCLRRETYDSSLPLEAVAGEGWLRHILATLLPADRPWAWWTRSSSARGLRSLAPQPMPTSVPLRSLDQLLVRRLFWRRRTLAVIPPSRQVARATVLDWAGIDTEHEPEFVVAPAPDLKAWDAREIEAWCRHRAAWRDPGAVATLPAERVVVLFDGDVYCALPAAQASAALEAVRLLAASWGLSVIPGPVEYAWPTTTDSLPDRSLARSRREAE